MGTCIDTRLFDLLALLKLGSKQFPATDSRAVKDQIKALAMMVLSLRSLRL